MTTRKKYLRGAVVLGLLALSAFVNPARAGVGPSTGCSDGIWGSPGTELPVLTSPITLALEVGRLDPSLPPYVQLCFSTTSAGNGSPALTGGWVVLLLDPNNPNVVCEKDTNPLVIGVDCNIGDLTPNSPGRTLNIVITLQGSPTPISVGAELGTPDVLACLRDFTVTAAVTQIGPYDIGVCTP